MTPSADELMLEGILCIECGIFLGEATGNPRVCLDCLKEGVS